MLFSCHLHPGLHAEGVYEYWEPTLELLLDKEIVTVFTVLNEEEYQMSLERLDALFCRYFKHYALAQTRYQKLIPCHIYHLKIKRRSIHSFSNVWDVICRVRFTFRGLCFNEVSISYS